MRWVACPDNFLLGFHPLFPLMHAKNPIFLDFSPQKLLITKYMYLAPKRSLQVAFPPKRLQCRNFNYNQISTSLILMQLNSYWSHWKEIFHKTDREKRNNSIEKSAFCGWIWRKFPKSQFNYSFLCVFSLTALWDCLKDTEDNRKKWKEGK